MYTAPVCLLHISHLQLTSFIWWSKASENTAPSSSSSFSCETVGGLPSPPTPHTTSRPDTLPTASRPPLLYHTAPEGHREVHVGIITEKFDISCDDYQPISHGSVFQNMMHLFCDVSHMDTTPVQRRTWGGEAGRGEGGREGRGGFYNSDITGSGGIFSYYMYLLRSR